MLGTQMQVAQFNMGNKETHMQAAQFNVGNKETHMANNVVKPNPTVSSSNSANALTMVGILPSSYLDLRHSIFSTQIVNRTTFNGDTWVIDIGQQIM